MEELLINMEGAFSKSKLNWDGIALSLHRAMIVGDILMQRSSLETHEVGGEIPITITDLQANVTESVMYECVSCRLNM